MYFYFDYPTKTTFKDMPMEPEVDDPGMIEIYRQMMLIDLFQTQFGGLISNLPVYKGSPMVRLLFLLAALLDMDIGQAQESHERTHQIVCRETNHAS